MKENIHSLCNSLVGMNFINKLQNCEKVFIYICLGTFLPATNYINAPIPLNKDQHITLIAKRRQLHLKLEAQAVIYNSILFHWLGYFQTIKRLGLFHKIEYLCTATLEALPYYTAALAGVNGLHQSAGQVLTNDEGRREQILAAYPSASPFKYVMNLPLLDECNQDVAAMLKKAQLSLQINNGPIYFFSPECSPVLQLKWDEILQHGNEIFDDSCISLVFISEDHSWIIFRSIENEWRCGLIEKRGNLP